MKFKAINISVMKNLKNEEMYEILLIKHFDEIEDDGNRLIMLLDENQL